MIPSYISSPGSVVDYLNRSIRTLGPRNGCVYEFRNDMSSIEIVATHRQPDSSHLIVTILPTSEIKRMRLHTGRRVEICRDFSNIIKKMIT